ncbi:hemerythrin domain-containing protein [Actinomadura chokoriensis]|uniref:Hemerythrin domain-containing protein n=1 Tax=Actinomadura chokoriensis TaxID=454156 RepID=A0ABV4R911_9ACTN
MEAFVARSRDAICQTLMHAAHDAFRRDLDRLAAAVAAGKGGAAHVRDGWDNLKDQLRMHQDVGERLLWPRVEHALAGRPAERAVLADMRDGHARIAALTACVDAALEDGRGAVAAVLALRETLEGHLRHEESTALPLAESVLEAGEWRALAAEAEGRCAPAAPLFVPWVVDGIAPVDRSRFLTALPGSVRARNRVTWEPRYRKRRLWSI